MLVHRGQQGQPAGHRNAQPAEALDLLRVVGQQAYRANPQVPENERSNSIIAPVGLVAQEQVGVYRIVALVLQVVGPQLFRQADAPAFLAQVDQHAASFSGDLLQGLIQLLCHSHSGLIPAPRR